MKLIVQIPCFNEEKTLPSVIETIPKKIDGVESIEVLVIDDGSTDNTVGVAKDLGVTHILRLEGNRGLAKAFRAGLEYAIDLRADIIVNTDGDNQYAGADIPKLIAPILEGRADIVVGCRGGLQNEHFPLWKRCLQVVGSSLIRRITRLNVSDAVSGFRALNRRSAGELNIVSDFSYTIEMLVHASVKKFRVASVPIDTNPKTRDSRLFKSVPQFLFLSLSTLLRVYVMYRPLVVFQVLGVLLLLIGLIPIVKFVAYYYLGEGQGHIQSLVLGGAFATVGVFTVLIGVVADLINFNRRLIEQVLLNQKKIEDRIRDLEEK